VIARSLLPRGTTRLSALAAAAVVVLTGCGALHPGSAAVVGPTTITHDRVDALAAALCSANIKGAEASGQQAPELPTRGSREAALQVLVDSRLSQLFGREKDVEPNRRIVSQAMAQNRQAVELLPESQRDAFRQALEEYATGQSILVEAGRASLAAQGRTDVPDDQAFAEGERLRGEYLKSVEVEVDPRYGSFEKGTLRPGGTSLSVPASDSARAAAAAQPAAGFVSALPASQRCS
jgi:hypothetical protein